MRLKSLYIDGFKNLKNFKIDFEKRKGVTVLIGNNASGKSNVLEAISAIFAGLYNSKLDALPFKFDLVYTIDSSDIRVSKKQKTRYRIKKTENTSWNNLKKMYSSDSRLPAKLPITLGEPYDYRPSQVIALYSGEELRLWEDYYEAPYFDFNNISLKNDVYLSKLNMIYVNKYYWNIALLTMYASDINGLEKIVKSELQNIKLKINTHLADDFRKQKPTNTVNNFIWDLLPVLANEKITKDYNKLTSFEVAGNIKIDLNEFKDRVEYKTHIELFKLLCVAHLPKDKNKKLMTDLELIFENGTTTKALSEGQKKQILLKLCLEVLADKNSLLLFDEPDAHIHIANKKLIPDMLEEYGNREIILTTHSPILAHLFDSKHLAYLKNGKINEEYNNQEKLLNDLTNESIGVSEKQILLQSNKDILIVEGKTDEYYIKQALKVLKKNHSEYKDLDFNFLWLGGSDKDALNKIIETFIPKKNQTIIAFLDSDSSGYNKCIKKALNITIEKKDFTGHKTDEGIYIHLYPKKPKFTQADFEVEDYFPIKVLRSFCITEAKTFQGIKSKFNKMEFAKECVKDNFDKSNFDGFKTLFDKIIEIKQNNNQ